MAEESDLERTEPASGRRLEQAREEGQVPHSRELSAFLVLVTAAASFWFLGGWFAERMIALTRSGLTISSELSQSHEAIPAHLAGVTVEALLLMAPLLGAIVIAGIASPLALNGWLFAPKALTPRFDRLNPLSGVKRIISVQGLVEMLKAVGKSILVGGVAVWLISRELDQLLGLLAQPLETALLDAGHLVTFSFLVIVMTMAIIAGIDVPFQLWQYHEKMKMTKEEVRQENKQNEGSPEVKGRIRRMQREAARRRMMAAVPKADVVVTNPTHFAVALKYSEGMRAPKVVAKGQDELALKIRTLAAEHNVPLLEAPPLARALYRWAELEEEIPSRLYAAVAEVLAYVYQLNHYRKQGGQYPLPPKAIEVPADLDPGVVNG